MSDYNKAPSFVETPLPGGAVDEIVIPLIARGRNGELLPFGTAFMIGIGLALTARHVIDDFMRRLEGREPAPGMAPPARFDLLSFMRLDGEDEMRALNITRIWTMMSLDIAVLQVVPNGPYDPARPHKVPSLELLPPEVGERIAAIGFANSEIGEGEDGHPAMHIHRSTSVGEVREVHPVYRDRARLSFPVFRTNARYDGGMSGAPVFNDRGAVCGIICSNMPPDDQGEHVSYASLLWPAMGISIDYPWDRHPEGTQYLLREPAEAGIIATRHLGNVTVEVRPDDTRDVHLWDHRGGLKYAKPPSLRERFDWRR